MATATAAAAADPSVTIRCNRRDDGPPFVLRQVPVGGGGGRLSVSDQGGGGDGGSAAVRVAASELELALTRRLSVNVPSEQDGDSSHDDLEYMTRYDVHWLDITSQPPNYELQTVLGIPEDRPRCCVQDGDVDDEDCLDASSTLNVDVVCFEAVATIDSSTPLPFLGGPTHDWKRRPITQSQLMDTSKIETVTNLLWWIDMRPLTSKVSTTMDDDADRQCQPLVKSQGGVVQLLRSILTSSHDASPWLVSQDDSARPQRQASPDIVVLVLSDDDSVERDSNDGGAGGRPTPSSSSVLKDFRVSDVAPSWFLHAVARMDHMEDVHSLFGHCVESSPFIDSDSDSVPIVSSIPRPRSNCQQLHSTHETSSAATLFIYKRLGQRTGLTAVHPITQSSDGIPLGCLWEAYNCPPDDIVTDHSVTAETTTDEKKDDSEKTNPPDGVTNNNTTGQHDHDCNDARNGGIINNNRSYRLTCPPYVNLEQDYPPSIQRLFSKESLQVFLNDAMSIPQWTPWPETAHYRVSSDDPDAVPWTVFPLCHCFPANKPEKLTWVPATKAYVPNTCQLLEDLVGCGRHGYLRTALFSQLAPHSVLEAHTGWADLANHVLRLHIPLIVPSEEEGLCGTWVDGCVETHKVGRPLLFDDSKIHRAFNYSDETRVVLIVDLARPDTLPVGAATGGHSEELDAFIQRMGVPR